METSTHYTSGNCVTKVTPTMQALGDQPFRCEVFKHTKSESIRETFIVDAGSRWQAARRAQELFDEKHGKDKLQLDEIITPRRVESPGCGLYSTTCEYCG